jgi:hypothetical protein
MQKSAANYGYRILLDHFRNNFMFHNDSGDLWLFLPSISIPSDNQILPFASAIETGTAWGII